MCKHVPCRDNEGRKGAWQPYSSEEIISGSQRTRDRGIIHQAVCSECGLLLGLPTKSALSGPYRRAAASLAKKHSLTTVQRRMINKKLERLDDAGLNRFQREDVFINAIQTYSSIPESEILTTVAKI